MCGRFSLASDFDELLERYDVSYPIEPFHKPRYNIAPAQMIPAVIHDGKNNRLGQLRWGLTPSWAKDESMASKMINARSETLLERPSFRNLVYRKRCVIPADSFYEWKTINGKKQPFRFMLKDGGVFSMAGLYDTWRCPQTGREVHSCAIITTAPNALIKEVHNRMPAILNKEDERAWLDRNNDDVDQLLSLLLPFPEEKMKSYPVSPIVGNVKNDRPECFEAVEI